MSAYDLAKSVLKGGARAAGLRVTRVTPRDLDLRRVQLCRAEGVGVVLDVGANAGWWARDLRRAGYQGRIVSFEPLSQAYGELEQAASADPLWFTHRLACAHAPGVTTINVAGNSWSSSLLPMSDEHRAAAPESGYVGMEQVRAVTLDEFCAGRLSEGESVYLKLDVQGGEREVLRGAGSVLLSVRLLELELSVVSLYEGQALYGEMLDFLTAQGFTLAGLSEEFINERTGRLLQFDGVFLRT
jgi:FkbM family methyltransferase